MAKHITHFNHNMQVVGSAKVPRGVGDRFWGQDQARDFRYLQGLTGRALQGLTGFQSGLLSLVGVASVGSSYTKVNVPAAVGLVMADVEVPNDALAWTVPAAIRTSQIPVVVEVPAITNLDVSGATFNGSTVNYVKAAYLEADLQQRQKHFAGGTYFYSKNDSFLVTCNPTPPTEYEFTILTFTGDGTSTMNIVRGSPINSMVGASVPFSSATPPEGWLVEDGSAVSRVAYANLFSRIGTTHGAGDGSTTFNLPDSREATVVGIGTRASGVAVHDTFALGEFKDDQKETHTHTISSGQGSHNHSQNAHNHAQDSHNHSQNAHGHSDNGHAHALTRNTTGAFVNGAGRLQLSDGALYDGQNTGTGYASITSNVATNNATTATNQSATATNVATTLPGMHADGTPTGRTGTVTRGKSVGKLWCIKY
jgi:microcystin-dependent protein